MPFLLIALVAVAVAMAWIFAIAVLYKLCSSTMPKTPRDCDGEGDEETLESSPTASYKSADEDEDARASSAITDSPMLSPLEVIVSENRVACYGTGSVRKIAQAYTATVFAQRMGIARDPPTIVDVSVETHAQVSVRNMVMRFEREHSSFGSPSSDHLPQPQDNRQARE